MVQRIVRGMREHGKALLVVVLNRAMKARAALRLRASRRSDRTEDVAMAGEARPEDRVPRVIPLARNLTLDGMGAECLSQWIRVPEAFSDAALVVVVRGGPSRGWLSAGFDRTTDDVAKDGVCAARFASFPVLASGVTWTRFPAPLGPTIRVRFRAECGCPTIETAYLERVAA